MKATHMSPQNAQRLKKQKQVKAKIQQIMTSVKQQKQHIQNKLATNDHKIHLYTQQYQKLKHHNDFTHLKHQEQILVKQLIKSLQQNNIDSKEIIGGKQIGLNVWNKVEYKQLNEEKKHKKLTKEQIIAVQTLMIDKLSQQLKARRQLKKQY